MQIFLPSLPAIQADLGVSAALAQMVFSLSMGAIAISMLIYGPLSDRFGRRPVLLVGLALMAIGGAVVGVFRVEDIRTIGPYLFLRPNFST